MKKQLQRKYGGIAVLFGAFLFVLLGLGACVNPLQETKERNPDGSTGVRISIVAGEERTLLPTAAFTKYTLHFEDDNSVEPDVDRTLTEANSEVIPLAPGVTWNITVTAYVEVNDSGVPAAGGTAQVTLTEGELKGVSIQLKPTTGGINGTFSYDVQYPGDVYDGSLAINTIPETTPTLISLLDSPDGGISLAPGYYRMKITLQTAYGMAVRTEIVHIYRGMETLGEFTFHEADFGNPLNISGTVDLSSLGPVDWAGIALYPDANFTYPEAFFGESDLSGVWSWTVPVPPFNRPTDLYVEFQFQLAEGGFLTKRLPAPVSVYNQDITIPLASLTVNRFDLSGVVGVDELTGLIDSDLASAQVTVYGDSDVPVYLGYADVDTGDASWSFSLLTEQSSLPARIVLMTQTTYGAFYDEIRTTLTGSRSDLNFSLKSVEAGTPLEGAALPASDYRYLFVPTSSDTYAFALSGASSQSVGLTLLNSTGYPLAYTTGYTDAVLSYSLTSGNVYYLALDLGSPNRAFHFQVNPVATVTLGGTVDFSRLLAPFEEPVTVSSATIALYDENSHAQLYSDNINPVTSAWSATVNLTKPSVPVVFAISATLSNGRVVNHSERLVVSGGDSSLAFSLASVTEGSPVVRSFVNQYYDRFLFVPAETGDYSIGIKGQAGSYKTLTLYDASDNSLISNTSGYSGELELNLTEANSLTGGKAYHVVLYSGGLQFETYRFQAEALLPTTLSGTVLFTGLAPLSAADVDHTEIQVFTGPSGSVYLDGTTAASNGSWSLEVPASGSQTVRIAALVYLDNGQTIYAQRQDTISGNTVGLDLTPTALALAGGQPFARTSLIGDAFVLVPSASGLFTLDVFSGGWPAMLSLYNATGDLFAQSNSGSLYTELSAGIAYIVRVGNIESFATYNVQLTAIVSTHIGGSVDYSGLPSSIRSIISSGTVSVYLPDNTQVFGGAAVNSSGVWSALVPSNIIGQTAHLIATLNLDNGLSIAGHIEAPLSGTALKFTPAAVAGNINSRVGGDLSDTFLFVPEASGKYAFEVSKDSASIGLELYDGLTGDQITSRSLYNYAEIIETLNVGAPYIVQVTHNGSTPDYQFYAGPALSLGGTVNFASLASWTTTSARILVFSPSGNNNYAVEETVTVSPASGPWSIRSLMPNGNKFFALVAQSSGGEGVLTAQKVNVTGNNSSINFSPAVGNKNVATGEWTNDLSVSDSAETWLLWIPPAAGKYVLDAEKISSMDPYMYLYDGVTGSLIDFNNDSGGTDNAQITRNDFAKGHPYLVRVRDWGNGSGSFRFKAEASQ